MLKACGLSVIVLHILSDAVIVKGALSSDIGSALMAVYALFALLAFALPVTVLGVEHAWRTGKLGLITSFIAQFALLLLVLLLAETGYFRWTGSFQVTRLGQPILMLVAQCALLLMIWGGIRSGEKDKPWSDETPSL